jgi:hypothetical protein
MLSHITVESKQSLFIQTLNKATEIFKTVKIKDKQFEGESTEGQLISESIQRLTLSLTRIISETKLESQIESNDSKLKNTTKPSCAVDLLALNFNRAAEFYEKLVNPSGQTSSFPSPLPVSSEQKALSNEWETIKKDINKNIEELDSELKKCGISGDQRTFIKKCALDFLKLLTAAVVGFFCLAGFSIPAGIIGAAVAATAYYTGSRQDTFFKPTPSSPPAAVDDAKKALEEINAPISKTLGG